jgi:hypothetical protein
MKLFLLVVAVLLVGIIVGFCLSRYYMDTTRFGNLIIDSTDPEKDLISFEMIAPLSKIINDNYTVLKVVVKK